MKLIKPSYTIIPQGQGLEGIYKQIELIGRVCTKSEDKITEYSCREFVDRMIKLNHGAVLEHGTVYLYIDYHKPDFGKVIDRYIHNKYSKCNYLPTFPNRAYISSNLRVLVENDWLADLKYLCEPTEFHEKRACVKFICDRGILAEFTRHRTFSFMAESSRYCNYSKDKFGNELTFIEPCWLENYNYEGNTYYNGFLVALRAAEANYFDLMKKWEDKIPDKRYKTGFRNNPWTPQQARAVLPNALKTELVMTGFVSDWKNFFNLRTPMSAHPQARELAIPLCEEFIKSKLLC